ncbi:MAG: hypothetical protein ACLGIV_07685 [Actinomycetes bacterium]
MDALAALIPSLGVALLFWYAVRLMIQADRRERTAVAKMEAAEKERVDKPSESADPENRS